jgi:hypothetical protein
VLVGIFRRFPKFTKLARMWRHAIIRKKSRIKSPVSQSPPQNDLAKSKIATKHAGEPLSELLNAEC